MPPALLQAMKPDERGCFALIILQPEFAFREGDNGIGAGLVEKPFVL